MEAAQKAIASPLLEEGSIEGAEGVLVNITGGPDLALQKVEDSLNIIQKAADEQAQIIFGSVVRDEQEEDVVITVIATGFDSKREAAELPHPFAFRGQKEQALDKPAYTRRKVSNGLDFYSPDEEMEEDDLEVPTFMRKQAD